MNRTITILLAFCLSYQSYSQSYGPSVVNSAGGFSQSGYCQFEWSIGEMALIGQFNSPGDKLIVTNGYIQPYILHPGTGSTNNVFEIDEVKVFPNPATTYVEVNFFTKQKGQLTLNFFDISGKQISSQSLRANGVDLITKIPLEKFAGGIYMLKIELEPDAGSVSKKGIYKIVKTGH